MSRRPSRQRTERDALGGFYALSIVPRTRREVVVIFGTIGTPSDKGPSPALGDSEKLASVWGL